MTKPAPKPIKDEPPKYRTVKTLVELAAFCGVSVKSVQNWKKERGFPIDESGEYSPVLVAEWRLLKKLEPSGGEAESDDDLSGPTSPMLERCREEKWKMYRFDRLEKEGQLVDRATIHSALARHAALFRDGFDNVQRMFGQDVFQFLVSMWDSAAESMRREFGRNDNNPE